MSKESYARGFCKAAESHGVNPYLLADILAPMSKRAQAGGIWESVKNVIDQVKQKWDDVDPSYKPLVGSVVGAGAGAGTGALAGKLFGFGAGKGALAGLSLGGIGGALYGAGKGNGQIKGELDKTDKKMRDAYGALSELYGNKYLNKEFAGKRNNDISGLVDWHALGTSQQNEALRYALRRGADMKLKEIEAFLDMIKKDEKGMPKDDVPVNIDL